MTTKFAVANFGPLSLTIDGAELPPQEARVFSAYPGKSPSIVEGTPTHFERAFAIIIDMEVGTDPNGGYTNDPHDPGGETRWGISKRAHPDVDVKNLTRHGAKLIYIPYWDTVGGDEMPWPLNLYAFDAAVNHGYGKGSGYPTEKMLQRALDVPQDGILGRNTMAAARNSKPWHAARFMAYRAMRYQGTRNFDRYGEGWLNRLFSVAARA